MAEDLRELIRGEEAKRAARWDARERQRVVLETLRWAAAQRTVRRNTPAACIAEQTRKLAMPCR